MAAPFDSRVSRQGQAVVFDPSNPLPATTIAIFQPGQIGFQRVTGAYIASFVNPIAFRLDGAVGVDPSQCFKAQNALLFNGPMMRGLVMCSFAIPFAVVNCTTGRVGVTR